METKKNPSKDYRKKSALFFNLGLVISIALVISAFEMKFEYAVSGIDLSGTYVAEPPVTIMSTVMPEKPKPIQVFNLVVVDNNKKADPTIIKIPEPSEDPVEIFVDSEPMPVEKPEEIFTIVESMPSSSEDFLKYVGENLKYPKQASRLDIEGKVFVQFIVSKDGKMKDIKIVRGLGYGCDEEVLRVMQMPYVWTPGKQRGEPVNVRMILPITFKLGRR